MQWQVLDRAFSGHATMVLIGDPKQAIYAFRGGDVVTYLDAADTAAHPADARGQLAQRRRPARRRSRRVLAGRRARATRGSWSTTSTAHHQEPAAGGCAARTRRSGCGWSAATSSAGAAPSRSPVGQVRPHIARDLAHDVRALLASDATFDGRPLEPRDVAVIAYRHADLAAAQAALREVGVPAVIAGGGSVFATPAAVEWLLLLEGLEQPHRSARVRAAALTCFFGRTAERARPGRRRAHRRGRRDAALVGRGLREPRGRGGAGGGDRAGPAGPRAVPRRRRAAAHRPAPHRRGAPRGGPDRAARAGLDAGVAARPGRRGPRAAAAPSAPAGSTPTRPRSSS